MLWTWTVVACVSFLCCLFFKLLVPAGPSSPARRGGYVTDYLQSTGLVFPYSRHSFCCQICMVSSWSSLLLPSCFRRIVARVWLSVCFAVFLSVAFGIQFLSLSSFADLGFGKQALLARRSLAGAAQPGWRGAAWLARHCCSSWGAARSEPLSRRASIVARRYRVSFLRLPPKTRRQHMLFRAHAARMIIL